MNTDTQNRIFQWIQTTTEKIQDFAVAEIPPFIHEYLNWKFWEAGIGVIFYVVGMLIFSTLLYYGWKWCIKFNNESESFDSAGIFIISGVATLIYILTMIFGFPYSQIKDCIQLKIAPKVYLVEKASELIKK